MSKPFPCCCTCQDCSPSWIAGSTPNWIVRFCGGLPLLPSNDWHFGSSSTGNQMFEDLVALGDISFNRTTVDPVTGFSSYWDISVGSAPGVPGRVKRSVNGFYLPFPAGTYWKYILETSPVETELSYSNLYFRPIVESKCTDGTRRVPAFVSPIGYTSLIATVNYNPTTGMSDGQTSLAEWKSPGTDPDNFEASKDCGAVLECPYWSALPFLNFVDMKMRWKPTTETLSC
jgi:hypothetical protein